MSGPDEGDQPLAARPPEDAGYLDIREEWGTKSAHSEVGTGSGAPPAPRERIDAATDNRVAAADGVPKKRVRGVARSIETRVDANNDKTLTFRVDRYDVAGNRLAPVGVEMRHQRGGLVTDGDEVEVVGKWSRGTLRATRIINLTSSAETRTLISPTVKWAALAIVVLGLAIAAVVLSGVLSSPAGATVRVPNVVGQSEGAALATLRDRGLSPQSTTEASDSIPVGQVIRTEPPADFPVARDSAIGVVVSSGPQGGAAPASPSVGMVRVPNVAGLSEGAAFDALREEGLSPRRTNVSSDTVPEGRVISTNPRAGSAVQPQSSITVAVSSGPTTINTPPPSVVLPDVAGDSEQIATQKLRDAEVVVVVVRESSAAVGAGTVIRSDPAGGTRVPVGSRVTLTVSSGPPSGTTAPAP